MRVSAIFLAPFLVLLTLGASSAQEQGFLGGITIGKNAANWEARLGGGIYDYGPFTPRHFSGGVLNAEILAPSPDFLDVLGAPRPYLGTDIAFASPAIHVFYAGLNWEAYVTDRLYFGASLGGSVNTRKRTASSGGIKRLGSNVLFHLQASIGFDITDSLTAQVYLNHFSNANLGSNNDGLESVGARIGLRF